MSLRVLSLKILRKESYIPVNPNHIVTVRSSTYNRDSKTARVLRENESVVMAEAVFFHFSSVELRCSGPDWYEFGDFCYKPFGDKKTWNQAQQACRSEEADLVSILSMKEQSWLESYLYMGMSLEAHGERLISVPLPFTSTVLSW